MARGKSAPDFTPRITGREDLRAHVERLPEAPGVYIMRGRDGSYLYVGKAARIRARVRQYFTGHDDRPFVAALANLLGDIETVVTASAQEALLLENTLVKRYRPRFNVQLRDDKDFLVLRLDPSARWPRLELVRRIRRDGALYFGPYASARAARATLRVVNRHFQLRTCTDRVLATRRRPCLQYHIERCPAPCVLDVPAERYEAQVRDTVLFLRGRTQELLSGIEARMKEAARNLEFERAARLRDQLTSLQSALSQQTVVGSGGEDLDAVGLYREGGQVEFAVLQVRGGRVLGVRTHGQRGMELPTPEVLASFLAAHYERAPADADEVLVGVELHEDDLRPLEAFLSERAGRRVRIRVPRRGRRRRLLGLAERNAAANFASRRNARADRDHALARLAARLRLSRAPRRIECYDISHTQGTDVRASMVVFVDAEPDRKSYRTFRVRGPAGEGPRNDDFAAMYEVLARRVARAREDEAWALPDLLVVDGGKGQLGRAMAALQDLGVPIGPEGVEVVALAKERRVPRPRAGGTSRTTGCRAAADRGTDLRSSSAREAGTRPGAVPGTAPEDYEVRPERVYVPGRKDPIVLRPGSSERHLMERVRDEAHRFALGRHRAARRRRTIRSRLSEVPGVGPKLERTLLSRFGSVQRIASAAEADLRRVPGVGPTLARRILEALGRPDPGA